MTTKCSKYDVLVQGIQNFFGDNIGSFS